MQRVEFPSVIRLVQREGSIFPTFSALELQVNYLQKEYGFFSFHGKSAKLVTCLG